MASSPPPEFTKGVNGVDKVILREVHGSFADCISPTYKVDSEKKVDEVKVKEEVAIGDNRWKGININEIDPDEVFKDDEDLISNGDDRISSEATFTWSRPGYRGYRGCELNKAGDYVGYDDGKLVVYNGSLDTDSEWNRCWCKRVKHKETSSDEDEVSFHPPAKKPKSARN
ncbi:hypothetical protein RND81_01G125600 [Saponaria officinalis]|uniref:Uncharacterized protein n=1 Tax=Saponaria officinalis TaxID=3572 RepID=A0AAW1NER1_SAPOF